MEEYQGLEATTAEALNGVWYERYKKQHMNIKASTKIKKPKFYPNIWNSIMNKVLTRHALYKEYTEAGLKVLVAAAQGATQEAERVFDSNANNSPNNTSSCSSNSGDVSKEDEDEDGESDDDDKEGNISIIMNFK
ncbi:hypothetical protein BDC45DRAFT_573399 [Circinella umbellata]|nr:hypothetical protein BDC45DRAFT_573399 [Circinella umbellata]